MILSFDVLITFILIKTVLVILCNRDVMDGGQVGPWPSIFSKSSSFRKLECFVENFSEFYIQGFRILSENHQTWPPLFYRCHDAPACKSEYFAPVLHYLYEQTGFSTFITNKKYLNRLLHCHLSKTSTDILLKYEHQLHRFFTFFGTVCRRIG